jgi:hypothetical protein
MRAKICGDITFEHAFEAVSEGVGGSFRGAEGKIPMLGKLCNRL